jgi:putative ABC transport system permease protein
MGAGTLLENVGYKSNNFFFYYSFYGIPTTPTLPFMTSNHIKTIWRSLLKDRQFTILNLLGLSMGLTCVLLIYLWVSDELAVDKFLSNNDRIFQVMAHIKLPDAIHTQDNTPYLLSRALASEIPEVENAVAVQSGFIDGTISANEKHITTRKYYVDYDFFKVFSFALISGNRNTVLDDKYSVLLSDKLAMKLFNTTENIIGKAIQWENDPRLFKVTGIFRAPSSNSSLKFEALFSYQLFFENNSEAGDWGNSNPSTFVLLKTGVNQAKLDSKFNLFLHRKDRNSPLTLSLRKFSDRYLYDRYENGVQSGGRITYVKLFSIIAVFILLIACINFMNLSTAKTTKRLKEAGIKKILGMERSSLIFQFISESLTMAFMALFIAILVAMLILPEFNNLTGKQLVIPFSIPFIVVLIVIGLFTGLMAGSYPAFYLSSFEPVNAIKGVFSTVKGELWMRKSLVVLQYILSIVFIVSVLVTYKQMKFIQTINLGYSKDNVISFQPGKKIRDNFSAFMNEIEHAHGVLATSSINGDMYGHASGSTEEANWDGNISAAKIMMTDLDIDYGLIELLGMKISEGRSFSKKFGSDSSSIILNESALHAMGINNPIGKSFDVWGKKYHVIGVTKDFHFSSLYEKVKPCFMRLNPGGRHILVKIASDHIPESISNIEDICKKYNPGLSFDFSFLDKDYEAMYVSEQREAVLLRWFAGLAIVISCLGLFGLAAFSAQKRQKEMSIRKIVGASIPNIATLLSVDFFKLIFLAMLVSFPLSWWAMTVWLDNFAYRINIDISVYVLTSLFILFIVLLTVGYQSIKAAIANPVKNLRME